MLFKIAVGYAMLFVTALLVVRAISAYNARRYPVYADRRSRDSSAR